MPRNITFLLTIFGICLYAIFTGGRPSSLRAAIMGSIVLLYKMNNKRVDALSVLSTSGLIILFLFPQDIFNSGFILSYIAVISIIEIFPRIVNRSEYIRKKTFLHILNQYVSKNVILSFSIYLISGRAAKNVYASNCVPLTDRFYRT